MKRTGLNYLWASPAKSSNNPSFRLSPSLHLEKLNHIVCVLMINNILHFQARRPKAEATDNIVSEKKREYSIALGKPEEFKWLAKTNTLQKGMLLESPCHLTHLNRKEVQTSRELLLLKDQPHLPKGWPIAPGVCSQLLLLSNSFWQGAFKAPCLELSGHPGISLLCSL